MKKIIALARFSIIEYYRSTWLYFEVIVAAVSLSLFCDKYWLLKAEDIYTGLGVFAMVSAFFTALRLLARETGLRLFAVLTKAVTRKEYLASKVLAAAFITCATALMLFMPGYFLTSVRAQFSFGEALARLVPVLLVAPLTASAVIAFSRLATNDPTAICWAIVLALFGLAHPPGALDMIAPPVQKLIKTAFAANAASVEGAAYVIFAIAYILALYALAAARFERRELNYDRD